MANHPSALKRHLQSLKRNAQNRSDRSKLATQVKKARLEISSKSVVSSNEGEVQKAVSLLAKSAKKGIIKKKISSRKISRLMKQAYPS